MRYRTRLYHSPWWLLATAWLACGDGSKHPLGANCESDSQCASGLCVESTCLDPAADADGDTLTNGTEATLGTNPYQADTDADGEDDQDEIDLAQLRHLDTDGDGKPDALESALTDADEDCIADEHDPDDAVRDPEGCGPEVGDLSCSAIYQASRVKPASGTYRVDPDGPGPEAPFDVECLMGVAEGGWTRLDATWHAWLSRAPIAPVPPREYLYLADGGDWHRTARTTAPFSWDAGAALPGVWFTFTADADIVSAFDCQAAPVTDIGGVGFGCYFPGAPHLQAVEGGSQTGIAELCRGMPTCTRVAIYMRDVPCAGEEGNLFGDGGFDAFAQGATSCWRIPLASPPTAPGAGVSADDPGARKDHAPALRAELFDYDGTWLTALEYDTVALAGHHAYLMSFWARADAPRPLIAVAGDESAILSLTTDWRAYEVGLAPDETEIDARPMILFGQLPGVIDTVWIDDAALVDVGPFECTPPPGELLAGGAFTAGTACWIPVAWSDAGTGGRFVTDPGDAPTPGDAPSLRIDHDTATGVSGPVLAQVSAPALAAHGYELALDARGAGEALRLRLGTQRSHDWPLDSVHALAQGWSHIVFRWDTPAELFEPGGVAVQIDPIGEGPGAIWIDDVHLVDLGADPCLPAVWATRGFIPDGEIDFGLRCWTYSAAEDAIVEPDVRTAWAGDRVPALRTEPGSSTQPMLVTSRPFPLTAGRYALTLRTRVAGDRMLYAMLMDGSGALVASSPIPVTQAWGPTTLAFELEAGATVTLQLESQGMPSSVLWVDGMLIEQAR